MKRILDIVITIPSLVFLLPVFVLSKLTYSTGIERTKNSQVLCSGGQG